MKRRISPAVALSFVALFFSLAGAGVAASGYRITSIWQIAPNVRHELRSTRALTQQVRALTREVRLMRATVQYDDMSIRCIGEFPVSDYATANTAALNVTVHGDHVGAWLLRDICRQRTEPVQVDAATRSRGGAADHTLRR